MTIRRLALSNKKLRGIPRRLRSLRNWTDAYNSYFPHISDSNYTYGYWKVKIPVISSLIQGEQTNIKIQSSCAQNLIDAAYNVYKAKPVDSGRVRVTCCIVLPDMFSSELCLFTSEIYFNEHTRKGCGRFGQLELLHDRSIIKEWGLILPDDFSELGILRTCENDDGDIYFSEHWYIGEVKNG